MQRAIEQKRILLSSALVAVLTIAAAGGYFIARLSRSGISSPELAAPRQLTPNDFWPDENGVLHFIALTNASHVSEGEASEEEVWFDLRNSRASEESRWDDGTIQSLKVVRGDHYDEYMVEGESKTDSRSIKHWRLLDGGAWSYWLSTSGLAISGAVQTGMIETQPAWVDGRSALRVEIAVLGESGEKLPSHVLYLDATTFLPMASEQTDDTGKRTIQDARYKVVEWVPQDSLDPAVFDLPANLPKATYEEWQTEMTVDEAQTFKDFDVYYLGDSFQDLKLYQLLEFRDSDGPHYVAANYSLDGTAASPMLQVTSELEGKSIQSPWNTPDQSKQDVTVDGTTGFYYPHNGLFLQQGNTVIHVSGSGEGGTENVILAAGDGLLRLNQ